MIDVFQFMCLVVVFNKNLKELEKFKYTLTGFGLGKIFLSSQCTKKTGYFSVDLHWTYLAMFPIYGKCQWSDVF